MFEKINLKTFEAKVTEANIFLYELITEDEDLKIKKYIKIDNQLNLKSFMDDKDLIKINFFSDICKNASAFFSTSKNYQ